jgi:DNA-binding CsgD family transcriptional regulator
MHERLNVSGNFAPQASTRVSLSDFPTAALFSALDHVKLGIAIVDRKLKFRSINRVLAEMNHLPPEAHTGRPLDSVLGPLFTEVWPPLEQVFKTGQPLPNIPLSGRLPARNDTVHWLQFFFPLIDCRGRVAEVGAFVMEKASPDAVSPGLAPPSGNQVSNCQSQRANDCQTELNLSGREREVLKLLATGNSNKQISSILGISAKTVETYRSRLVLKIRAPSLSHLIHYAIRHQIVQLQ